MGNFSRNTFDELKHYVGVRLQQGVPLVDADWNEMEDIRKYELKAFLKWFVGNGAPRGSDGFHILPAEPASNDFRIQLGRCLVDGWDVMNDILIGYASQHLYLHPEKATSWGVPPLSPLTLPAAVRTDVVYVDAWEREVNSSEDKSLIDDRIGIETCVRLKCEWVVRVHENVTNVAQWTPPNPLTRHAYYALAYLTRPAGSATISADQIADVRRTNLGLLSLTGIEITGDGKVGIGTTSPAARLDIENSTLDLPSLRSRTLTIDSGQGLGLANFVAGAKIVSKDESKYHEYLIDGRGAARLLLHDGRASLSVGGESGTAGAQVTWNDALNINPSGNVGIGTTEPGKKLTISAASDHLQLRREASETTGGKQLFLELYQDKTAPGSLFPEVYPSIRFHHGYTFWNRLEARMNGFHFKHGDLNSDSYVPIYADRLIELDGYCDAAQGMPVTVPTDTVVYKGGPTFRNTDSYWQIPPGAALPSTMTVDLGVECWAIQSIGFGTHWRGDGRFMPKAYCIEIRSDDKDWVKVVEVTDNTNIAVMHPVSIPSGRYVRLTISAAQPRGAGEEVYVHVAGFQVLVADGGALGGRYPWASRPGGNVILANDGNVSIGTNAPNRAKLEVAGTAGSTAGLFGAGQQGISLVSNWPSVGFNAYMGDKWRSIAAGWTGVLDVDQNNGSIDINTGPRANAADEEILLTRRLTIDKDGNVGIGTTPSVNGLHIGTGVQGGEAQLQLDNANGQSGQINRWTNRLEILASDQICMAIGSIGSNRLTIANDGRVDISGGLTVGANLRMCGTDLMIVGRGGGKGNNDKAGRALVDFGPDGGLVVNFANDFGKAVIDSDLAVNGAVGIASSLSVPGALSFGALTRQMINLYGTEYGIGVQLGTQYYRTDKNFAWYKGGKHDTAELNAGGGTLQMMIQDGKVGIGTTDPKDKLHVKDGCLRIGDDVGSGNLLRLEINDNNEDKEAVIRYDTANLTFWAPEDRSNPDQGGRNVMALKNNGNVGIGIDPEVKLHVKDGNLRIARDYSDATRFLDIGLDRAGDTNLPESVISFDTETLSFWAVLQSTGSGHDFMILKRSNGDVVIPRLIANPHSPSSRELKSNIVAFSLGTALKCLSELNAVSFTYKNDPSEQYSLGFIAEEAPDIITTPDKKAVIPLHIITVLSKVVQEQQKTIAVLQTDVGHLKAISNLSFP